MDGAGRRLLGYFAALRAARLALWCYLLWYLFAVARYFDPQPALWLTSLGISAIVGTALYLSTARAGRQRVRLEKWQVARFFLMPFCVSSFAALIKGRGFVLVFHPSWRDNLLAASACALFVAGSRALSRRRHGAAICRTAGACAVGFEPDTSSRASADFSDSSAAPAAVLALREARARLLSALWLHGRRPPRDGLSPRVRATIAAKVVSE